MDEDKSCRRCQHYPGHGVVCVARDPNVKMPERWADMRITCFGYVRNDVACLEIKIIKLKSAIAMAEEELRAAREAP